MPRRGFALGTLVLLLAAVGSACGVGDARTRTLAPGHHHVLLVGDSLMGNTAPQLPEPVSDAGWDATFIDAHQNGTGVLGPVGDQPDALSYVKAQIAAHPEVDTVVIECGRGLRDVRHDRARLRH